MNVTYQYKSLFVSLQMYFETLRNLHKLDMPFLVAEELELAHSDSMPAMAFTRHARHTLSACPVPPVPYPRTAELGDLAVWFLPSDEVIDWDNKASGL